MRMEGRFKGCSAWWAGGVAGKMRSLEQECSAPAGSSGGRSAESLPNLLPAAPIAMIRSVGAPPDAAVVAGIVDNPDILSPEKR